MKNQEITVHVVNYSSAKLKTTQINLKYQEITGRQNGFPNKVDGVGPYVGIKIELPIIPDELYLCLGAKGNKIKNIGDSRVTAGLKMTLN